MRKSSCKPTHSKVFAVIILSCLGIIIYSNTLHSSFHFDDNSSIVNNLSIRNLANLRAIWNFWPTRLITYLSFTFNYHLHQLDVFGYHLFNLIIHISSAIMAWWFISLIFSIPVKKKDEISQYSGLMALFGALIFLSHPIQTESVTYICQRATSLAGFFYLFSLCLYVKSRLLLQAEDNPVVKWRILYVFSWVIGIVGMFTKENTSTLPLMIIFYEFCFFRTDGYIKWKYTAPFLIILPIIPILLFYTRPITFADVQRLMDYPVNTGGYYFLTQLRVMVTYIRLLFIPLNQNLDYDYPITKTLVELPTLASLFLLVLILITAIRIFPRYRLISFGIFWFFLTLLPESSIIPLKDVIFEHRLYLPMVGYSLFLISIAYHLFGNKTLRMMVVILVIIVSWYSILTYARNFVWKNEFILWDDTVHKSPQKVRPYYNRGAAYAEKGNLEQAISDFSKAIEIDPNNVDAYNNRGAAYAEKGNLEQAISDFSKAIEIDPNCAEAHYNRGVAYQNKGNLEQAISDYNKALEINPNDAQAYNKRGLVYFLNREYDKSWEDMHKAEALGYKVDSEFLEKLKKASASGGER